MSDKEILQAYQEKYGEPNPLYNQCGNCQYEDEYGCWQNHVKGKLNIS